MNKEAAGADCIDIDWIDYENIDVLDHLEKEVINLKLLIFKL